MTAIAKSRVGVCGAAAVALLAAVCLPVSAAKAATITETYDFTASGFGSGSPVSTWSGSFTITFTLPNFFPPTVPLSLDAFSSNLTTLFPASYPANNFTIAEDLAPNPATGALIYIGDHCFVLVCDTVTGSDQAFVSFFVDASGNPSSFDTQISWASGQSLGSVSVTLTPLPAALPLFAGGLGLLGWRRKRSAAVKG